LQGLAAAHHARLGAVCVDDAQRRGGDLFVAPDALG